MSESQQRTRSAPHANPLDALDAQDAAQGGQLSLDFALDGEAQCRTRTGDPSLPLSLGRISSAYSRLPTRMIWLQSGWNRERARRRRIAPFVDLVDAHWTRRRGVIGASLAPVPGPFAAEERCRSAKAG